MRLFRDFILQGQPHLLPLHLASFRAYASSTSLPICLQGSIPGSWLAITWTGFPPASLCSIARPQRLFNPYTRFEYTHLELDGYQESGGGGFAMDVGSQSISSAISTLGTQVSYNSSQPWGILVPFIRVEWEHQYLNNNQNIPMTLAAAAAGTGSFVIQTSLIATT